MSASESNPKLPEFANIARPVQCLDGEVRVLVDADKVARIEKRSVNKVYLSVVRLVGHPGPHVYELGGAEYERARYSATPQLGMDEEGWAVYCRHRRFGHKRRSRNACAPASISVAAGSSQLSTEEAERKADEFLATPSRRTPSPITVEGAGMPAAGRVAEPVVGDEDAAELSKGVADEGAQAIPATALVVSDVQLLYFEGAHVRVLRDDLGEPWFVGRDVCSVLGYADPTTAMRSHCRGVQKLHPMFDSLGRSQEVRVLSEPDVLRLIVGCTLPAAVRFERWVFEEVLPTIRRTGRYEMPQAQQAQPALLSDKQDKVAAIMMVGDYLLRVPGVNPGMAAAAILRCVKLNTDIDLAPAGLALPAAVGETGAWNATRLGEAVFAAERLAGMRAAVAVNKALMTHGYIVKVGEGYDLTAKGVPYADKVPYQGEVSGHAGWRILWKPSFAKVLRADIDRSEQEDAA